MASLRLSLPLHSLFKFVFDKLCHLSGQSLYFGTAQTLGLHRRQYMYRNLAGLHGEVTVALKDGSCAEYGNGHNGRTVLLAILNAPPRKGPMPPSSPL